jgi:hypothetical protein
VITTVTWTSTPLSERAKGNYLFARAMVGREYATPLVQASEA